MSKCLLLLAAVVALANAKCPGSKAFIHAKTEMTVTFQDSCADVQGVIKARISGSTSGTWVDPHNKGHYVLKSSSAEGMALQHITSGKNHGGPYTDEVLLTFTSSGAGCSVDACSESQVTSVLDFSTNFCNIHDLYCSDAGCNPIAGANKLAYTEKIIENSSKQHSTSDCYKSSAAVAEVQPLLSDDDMVTLFKVSGGDCGQATLASKYATYAEKFAGLEVGSCASQGYTVSAGDKTIKVPVLGDITIATFTKAVLEVAAAKAPCAVLLDRVHEGVFADMHDGDQKKVTQENGKLTIVPHANNQTWVVESSVDRDSCSAVIDFNVPGKPGVPPVNLTATFYTMSRVGKTKIGVEFTDPSGTIAKPGFPLNVWVQIA